MNETSLIAPSAEAVSLHAELVVVSKDYHQAEHRLAVLLARMQADQLHRELGYANVIDYAEQELGLARSTAFALAKLGRELPMAPVVEQALAEGSLGWTKARELLKVVVPETEQEWVDFAKTSSSRDLERQVRSAVPGDSPHVGTPKLPELGRMTISGATVDLEIIQDCIRWARANTGIAKDHVDDAAILASLLQRAVEAAADAEQLPPSRELYRVLVIEACDHCGRTSGTHAEIPDTIVREARCDCEVVDLREGDTHGHTTHNIPPATRQAVLSRDQGLCRVPGCTNRAHTVLHHVVFQSDGGVHVVYNLISLCSSHHRMLHAGYLAIEHEGGGYLFSFPTGREVWAPHDPRDGGACERRGGMSVRPAPERTGSADSAGSARSAGADRATGPGRSSGATTSARSGRSSASRTKRRSAKRVVSDSGPR